MRGKTDMMRIVDQETRKAWLEVQQLLSDYWQEIDFDQARRAPEFYTEDCVLSPNAGREYRGRPGVRQFYDERAKRGQRHTRHVVHNMRVNLETPSLARVNFILVLYATDGTGPAIDYEGPDVVMDADWLLQRDISGHWRFKELKGSPAFIGTEPYSRGQLLKSS